MLSRKIPKLRLELNSKGGSGHYTDNAKLYSIGKSMLNGIPVLSIFALVGIIGVSISVSNIDNLSFGSDSYKAYATEISSASDISSSTDNIMPLADTSASLTVDDNKIKDTIFASTGELAYASHKVSVNATNIKSYTLTISGPESLSSSAGGTITGANNANAESMSDSWGYAWVDEGTSPSDTNTKYQSLSASGKTLASNTNIDTNHNVNYSKQLIFGAKFTNAPSGTYSAEVNLSLVATPYTLTVYTLNYNANTGANAPENQIFRDEDNRSSYTFTVSDEKPTKAGYIFLGWADSSNATAAQYNAGSQIILYPTNATKTIYAVWRQDITWDNITKMQQMTAEVCAGVSIGATKTLTDTRDGSSYTIRKHEDENCWMTSNLRLTGSRVLTSADSDVTRDWSLPGSKDYSGDNVSGWQDTEAKATQLVYFGNSTNGAYYSWCAATAGTCVDNTGMILSTNAEASESICPLGWKLPSMSTGASSFSNFLSKAGISGSAGSTIMRNTIYKFAFSGDVGNGSLGQVGSRGRFWSKTSQNDSQAYNLAFDGSYVGSAGARKADGLTIRCVAPSE